MAVSFERDSMWTAIERAVIAAALAEITPSDACMRMCDAVKEHTGTNCTLSAGHPPTNDGSGIHVQVGSAANETASTLVLPCTHGLEDATLDRLKRLFDMVIDLTAALPKGANDLHQVRNRFAGLLANIEFIEMVITEAGHELAPGEKLDLKIALGHAVTACHEIAKKLRSFNSLT